MFKMRTGRLLGWVVGGVVALFVLALVAVKVLVDPTLYKDRIAAAVRQATGRELDLKGDIKLSVFPWMALEVGPASLGNPPGFGAEPFLSFRHATVRPKWLPLFQKRLEVARLEIDGLDVRLQTDSQGHGNWETPESTGGPDAQRSAGAASDREATAALPGLNDLRLTHARVSYQAIVVSALSVETGRITEGVIPIALHFDVARGVASQSASVDAKFDFSGDPADKRYRVAALTVLGQVHLADNPRPLRWNLSLPAIEVNLNDQTVSAPGIALTVSGAQLTGNLQATHLLDDATLSGSLSLAPLVLREFFPRWGLTAPKTQDPRAFSALAGSTDFSYRAKRVRLDNLRLALDDTHVQGNAVLNADDTPALDFALTADKIDLDRYFAPDEQPSLPQPATKPPQPEAEPAQGPSAAKQPFRANGTLALGSLHLARLDLTDLRLTLAADDGLVRLFPLQAQVDGGRYAGDIAFDHSGRVPSLSVDEHLSGVDMGRLLATRGRKVHLSGTGDFSVKAQGSGTSSEAMLRTLTGHVEARLTEGAVEGVDLGYDLNRAQTLIDPGAAPAVPDTGRTRFEVFQATADITNGVARTSDLTISSPVLHISGQGSTDLSTKGIDFALLAEPILSGGTRIEVPVKVTGTTADPTVRPDIAAMAKGQLGQKLKDVLRDKLQGLFGKP